MTQRTRHSARVGWRHGEQAGSLGGDVADVANELGGDAVHELWVALHDYNGLGGDKAHKLSSDMTRGWHVNTARVNMARETAGRCV